ncbi:MAG: hypothetical protein FVQ79_09245 [Planctomycetes bacterium]|nr:hypothetical protein [Planctomycetota bacterium]
MKTEILKNRLKHLVRALIALSVLMACAMAAKVSAFVLEADSIPQRIEKALTVDSKKDDRLKEFQSQHAKIAKKLKEKSLFASSSPEKKNPVTKVDGIIGNSALIGGKLYKKGDKIGDAKILSIDPKSITVRWNKQEIQVSPFDHSVPLAPRKKNANKTKSKTAKKTVVKDKPKKVKPVQSERPDPRQMSSEQRARSRERSGERRGRGGRSGRGRGSRRNREGR